MQLRENRVVYCYVYENGRVEWTNQHVEQIPDECRDVFEFYMLNGMLACQAIKGVNTVINENWE